MDIYEGERARVIADVPDDVERSMYYSENPCASIRRFSGQMREESAVPPINMETQRCRALKNS